MRPLCIWGFIMNLYEYENLFRGRTGKDWFYKEGKNNKNSLEIIKDINVLLDLNIYEFINIILFS